MQNRLQSAGASLANEIVNLPNTDTPNWKVGATATAFLALDTLVASMSCGSFSYYLNAAATLFAAGVTVNQYCEGKPMQYAKTYGTQAYNTGMGMFAAAKKPSAKDHASDDEDELRAAIDTAIPKM